MPPKGNARKGSGGANDATPENRSKQLACKKQCPPVLSDPTERESELNGVMDMLMDISSILQATEQFMAEVRADKVAEATHRE